MSDARDAFGPLLERLQGEMRQTKAAIDLLARTLPGQVQVMVLDLQAALNDQMADRFDRLERRLDQTEQSVEERLGRIEKLLTEVPR